MASDQSSAESSGGKTITLRMPAGTQASTLRAVLNGKDVSAGFTQTSCAGSNDICETATLFTPDGLHNGKNVLYAIARRSDNTLVSSRLRFNAGAPTARARSLTSLTSRGAVSRAAASNIADTSFLPPTVGFNTLTPGGWQGTTPWFQVGKEQLPSSGDSPCSSQIYTVVVLDRQTLEEVSGATQCVADAPTLKTYLGTLTADEIVIVGTNWLHNADGNLDTSAIGGTDYSSISQTGNTYPRGYMAIGAGGAAPGSAYENYYTDSIGTIDPFATGMLTEDANGDYNFQSSGTFEYIVNPNDATNNNLTTITLLNVGSLPQYNQFSYPDKVVFYSPANQINGYWLLILERDNLNFSQQCGATANSAKQQTDVMNCGSFYWTGPGSSTRPASLTALATALNGLNQNQLAILTTVGTPSLASPWDMANNNDNSSLGNGTWSDNGYIELSAALQRLGAPDKTTLYLGSANSAFTYVTAPGLGNALSGRSALSSTFFSGQGQSGYIHGTFTRDLHGLFRPGRTELETAGADSANFALDLITSQQPVDWPEFASVLPQATSLAGQEDAYAYLSWYLLNAYYVPGQVGSQGVSGTYAYDIHYFFTGSLNTYIDIHNFDPLNAVWPGTPGFSGLWNYPCQNVSNSSPPVCTWVSPFDQTQLQFTQGDFMAVQNQMHNEIVDLTNVLLYMVNGSTNMKDIVAAGNSSAALALLGAASEVAGSLNQPNVQSQPVKVSPSNIANMVGGVLTTLSAIGTEGLVGPESAGALDKVIGVVADLFTNAGGAAGGFTSGGGTTSSGLPSPDFTLVTTVGQLANSDLQGEVLAGFDTTLDTITGDWGKLNALGPQITDPNNATFFSPNQVLQNASITLMNRASQRSLYLSLMPLFYQAHRWPMVNGGPDQPNIPDMGYTSNGNQGNCHAFYRPSNNPPPAYVSIGYPSYGGIWYTPLWAGGDQAYPFQWDWSNNPIDVFVIATPFQNIGASDAYADFPDSQLATALFANQPGALNFSIDAFLAQGGPMQAPLNGPSAFRDGAVITDAQNQLNFVGDHLGNICSVSFLGSTAGSPSPSNTTTTLVAPSSALLGESVPLQATVAFVNPGSVPVGAVQFRDGSIVLATVTLDASGNASFSATGLAIGTHSLSAYYIASGGSDPSNSAVITLTVYANSPDLVLSLSASSLEVSYGQTSPAVAVQVVSLTGLAGTVTFSCTGLPVGMTCNFNPPQQTITPGGQITSSLTISSPTTASLKLNGTAGILLFPAPLLGLCSIRSGRRRLQRYLVVLLLTVIFAGCMLGCGGSSQVVRPVQETGSKTILVNASCGSATRTIPLVVNID